MDDCVYVNKSNNVLAIQWNGSNVDDVLQFSKQHIKSVPNAVIFTHFDDELNEYKVIVDYKNNPWMIDVKKNDYIVIRDGKLIVMPSKQFNKYYEKRRYRDE